jgi:peptidoglycan/LPS O-acetylase OafA/YrhL
MYHFFIGALIYTQHQKNGFNSRFIASISVALLIVIFSLNSSLLTMFGLFLLGPFVVLANAKVTLDGLVKKISTWLGKISYPLYITHYPVFQLLYLFGHLEKLPPSLKALTLGLITITFAWLLSIADSRFRAKLSERADKG